MARIAIVAAVGVLLARAALAAGQVGSLVPAVSHAQSPAAVYERACATCHGPDGRGASRASATFSDPLPDFQDCAFATREPDADWLAVIHDGRASARFRPHDAGVLRCADGG